MPDHPSNRTPHCWHLSGTQFRNVFNYWLMCYRFCLGRAGKEAWEETWFVAVLGTVVLLRVIFVLCFVLFCFNQSLLSCCQLWSKSSCTKSLNFPLHRDMRLHHPRLKCHVWLFPAGDAGKHPKALHGWGLQPEPGRSSRPDHSPAPPLLTLSSEITTSASHPKP